MSDVIERAEAVLEHRDTRIGHGPQPKPEPPNMDGLFDRPQRAVRMLTQPDLVTSDV